MAPSIGIGIRIGGNRGVAIATPTGLVLVLIAGGIRLTWIDVTGEDGYEIWVSINGGIHTLLNTVAANVVTYDDMTDYAGSTVSYEIRAYKGISYSDYSDEATIVVWDSRASTLFVNMAAQGETASDGLKSAMNTAILALKVNNVFDTQFDRLIVYRNIGRWSAKMNWIKDAQNATEVANGGTLTFTTKVGFNSDGVKSSIRQNYIPSSDGVLFKRDDACYLLKISGTIVNATAHGCGSSTTYVHFYQAGTPSNTLNSWNAEITPRVVGYNCTSRANNTTISALRNASKTDTTVASVGLPDREMYSCGINDNNVIGYFTKTTEILEIEAQGKQLSQANFNTFQTIMDAFFTALALL
jgi:hypothetical protein